MGKINSKDYVVLDVETNGLSSLKHDLLSISIYKPDDNKTYDRFLPLELNSFVKTYWINGIDEDMLSDKTPLTQEEFDELVNDFELDRRTILTYGSIDEKFIKNYLKRKKHQFQRNNILLLYPIHFQYHSGVKSKLYLELNKNKIVRLLWANVLRKYPN